MLTKDVSYSYQVMRIKFVFVFKTTSVASKRTILLTISGYHRPRTSAILGESKGALSTLLNTAQPYELR